MITQQSFMFLSSYEKLRAWLREQVGIETMAHTGTGAFVEIGGEVVNTTAFVLRQDADTLRREDTTGTYYRLVHAGNGDAKRVALEQALADPGFTGRPARFVLELERPFGFDPVTVTAEVTRPGRSVRSAAAEVHDDRGRRLARATLLSIRTTDLDVTGAVRPDDEPPPPRPAHADPPSPWAAGGGRAFHRDAVEHAFVEGGFEALGPAVDWIRLVVPVVVGEDPSPLQRVVAAADFGNGISAAVTHAEHLFINPDLVVSLERLPVGIDVGLAAATRVDRGGIGLAEAVLWDEHGRIGHSSQTLLVQRRT